MTKDINKTSSVINNNSTFSDSKCTSLYTHSHIFNENAFKFIHTLCEKTFHSIDYALGYILENKNM